MLGKLLKYEVKATGRLFLPLYLAILLFAFVNRLINPFERVGNSFTSTVEGFSFLNMIRMMGAFVYFALIVAVIAMTFIIMIQRFYKNLLGDEGYLMFTLPVKPWQHIISKLLVSLLWIVLSFIIIVCSVFILINVDNLFGELGRIISSARTFFGDTVLSLMPVSALILSSYTIITIYNALSIGHMFTKHKILASFGAYVVIYITSQIVFTILALLFANRLLVPFAESPMPMPSQIAAVIAALTTVYALLAVGNFIVANIILNTKLNLE